MGLVRPDIGLLFWMMITFITVMIVLKKFAWKPILNNLKERDNNIASALKAAELAKQEMAQLKADNEKIMTEAKAERDNLLKEARDLKDKIIETARQNFRSEKDAAINEIKNQVATLSVQVAEKILKQKLSEYSDQKVLMDGLMKDLKLN